MAQRELAEVTQTIRRTRCYSSRRRSTSSLLWCASPGATPWWGCCHGRGVHRGCLEGEHAEQVPPLGRAEGGMPVLWEGVI